MPAARSWASEYPWCDVCTGRLTSVSTPHHGYSEAQLRAAGIDPGLVRVSLGVEDAADLIADADAALAAVPAS